MFVLVCDSVSRELLSNVIVPDDIREQLSSKVAIHQTIQYFSEILEAENDPNDEINQKLRFDIELSEDKILEIIERNNKNKPVPHQLARALFYIG